MAVLDIVHYGNPILRKKTESVSEFSSIDRILEDMFDSMYEAEGIGLAANQVGLDMHIFIIDITHTDESEDTHVFINSEIISSDGDKELFQEGCLSLPGIALDVFRPPRVTLKYQTPDQKWHKNQFEGLLGRAIQHEIDHLNGLFIVDRVGEVARIQYQTELKELENSSKASLASVSGKKGFLL